MPEQSRGLLLDTCAVIWVFEGADISREAQQAVEYAARNGALHLSPISAWEIGLLVSKGRISLSMQVEDWIRAVYNHPSVTQAQLPIHTLVQSSFLPGTAPKDPADRMILATARHERLRIVTRDRLILRYAAAGNAQALAC